MSPAQVVLWVGEDGREELWGPRCRVGAFSIDCCASGADFEQPASPLLALAEMSFQLVQPGRQGGLPCLLPAGRRSRESSRGPHGAAKPHHGGRCDSRKPRLRSTEFSPASVPGARSRVCTIALPLPRSSSAPRSYATSGILGSCATACFGSRPHALDASLLQPVRHPLIARDSIPLESAPLKQPSSGPPVCLLLVYFNFDALKAGGWKPRRGGQGIPKLKVCELPFLLRPPVLWRFASDKTSTACACPR